MITTGAAAGDATQALRELGASVFVVVRANDRRRREGGPLVDTNVTISAVLTKADLDSFVSLGAQ